MTAATIIEPLLQACLVVHGTPPIKTVLPLVRVTAVCRSVTFDARGVRHGWLANTVHELQSERNVVSQTNCTSCCRTEATWVQTTTYA